jgi:toxin YoeB
MNTRFEDNSLEEYDYWAQNDKKIFAKLIGLIKEIKRTPFSGTGKPEPLKYDLTGWWSRRITGENRIVYRIEEDTLRIHSCKYHYSD